MIRTKAPISAAALNVPRPIHLATVSALPLTIDERYEPWVRFAAVISCPSYAPEVVGPRYLGVGGEPEFSHRGDRNRIDGESATPIAACVDIVRKTMSAHLVTGYSPKWSLRTFFYGLEKGVRSRVMCESPKLVRQQEEIALRLHFAKVSAFNFVIQSLGT